MLEYPSNGWKKSHVEHAIGLVQDETRHRLERNGPLGEMIQQPAGSRNDDIGASFEIARLDAESDAAIHRRNLQARISRQQPEMRSDLRGELARRNDDQRTMFRACRVQMRVKER